MFNSLNHVDVNLTLWFLIKSGYYIVTSPSTALKKTKHQGIPSESLTLWWNTQDGKIRSLKRTLNGQRTRRSLRFRGSLLNLVLWWCYICILTTSLSEWPRTNEDSQSMSCDRCGSVRASSSHTKIWLARVNHALNSIIKEHARLTFLKQIPPFILNGLLVY